jgi:hypothetical protein
LRPGGILVLGTPDYGTWQWNILEWIYARVAPGAYADEHVTHYTEATLREALAARECEWIAHDHVGGGEIIIQARKKA